MIPHKSPYRGATCNEKQSFLQAYQSPIIFETTRPVIRFSHEAAEVFRKASELRRKDWRSTSRWNEAADFTGLMGEVAVQFYLGISPETAMAEFQAGLRGDHGHDVETQGLKLDVKSTKGDALRYKFSKTNPHTQRADGFIFTYVEDAGFEVRVQLLGWSYRADIKPFLRDDGQRLFVRAETLCREGVLQPVSLLKDSPKTLQTIHQ